MSASSVVLHSYFRSSCSYRVRIALALKRVDYEYRPVNLLAGEHLREEFLRLNPCAEVPVLVLNGGDIVLTHSNAILEYLEEAFPDPPLLPPRGDHASRAKVRALVDSIVSDIQPVQNMRVLQALPQGAPAPVEWGRQWVERGFGALERLLGSTHGLYCFGDRVTLADVCLVPQVFNADRFQVDMTKFPLIARISSALSELPAFRAAHPFVQPDCPAELRKTEKAS